ncbi:MAG TPA: DUF2934 domain-containing protein [Gemmataceae bacterium]|nr:DUF2934 domain-containing protein [Gemmataceae bacterium]
MIASTNPRSISYGCHTTGRDSSHLRRQSIERLAYEKWTAKGSPSGSALQDWLEAELEVDGGRRRQLIQRRAYGDWKAKGCPSMTALQDWLEAEHEVDRGLKSESSPYLCRIQMPVEILPG